MQNIPGRFLRAASFAWAVALLSPQVSAQEVSSVQSYRPGTGRVHALYGIKSRRFSGSAEDAARQFLAERHSTLRIESDAASLKTHRVVRAPGGTHVRFAQTYHGIPVYRAEVVVSVNDANEVGTMISSSRPDIRLLSLTPSLSPDQAVTFARTALTARGPALRNTESADLTIYRMPDGEDRLAYRITSVLEDPPGDWEVLIDAQTGAELSREDRYVNATAQGTGYVFRRNPLSASRHHYGDPGFTNDSDSDSLNACRALVTLDSIALDAGLYRLAGPGCIITDIESPIDSVSYAEVSPDAFRYRRSQAGFEAVMAYYHTTLAHERVRALGFDIPALASLRVDPHGYQGKDNSHYSPGGNWMAFGTGGVDDAEDADVIWHEYGHAIQYNIIPSWGGSECAALGEGFGDYWAASYARSLGEWTPAEPEYNWIFGWDGHNPYWNGRILNDERKYPFPSGSVHIAGQIWASALMGIHDDLGRDVADRIILKSLYYLAPEATATDNAQALLQADRDLYGGAHLPTLMYWLLTVKNFLPTTGTDLVLVVSDESAPALSGTAGSGSTDAFKAFSPILASLPLALNIQSTTFAGLDTSVLSSTRALVLLGGANPLPFNDAVKREAIVRFVRQGGRALVEGGDVGYAYRYAADGTERDSAFRTALLHTRAFLGDGPGTSLLPPGSDNTVFSWPHRLDVPLSFTATTSPRARDQMEPVADRHTLLMGTWSDARHTGAVVAHLDDSGSVRTMYLPFSLGMLADSAAASELAENAISFLLTHKHAMTENATEGDPVPVGFQLLQNYPNPFNPGTTFVFDLGERSQVSLEVFSILGQRVAVVAQGEYDAGRHEIRWEATGRSGGHLSSGTYFFRLTSEGKGRKETSTRAMSLIR
jgi:Zn-dependent metalloprotease